MSVFVKKLVEKAFLKKPAAGFSDSLEPDDINPRLVFHYGIPSGSTLLAYDSIQQILAISTKDGNIKLFGKDGSQALLESSDTAPGLFLLFIENQGLLVHVNVNNRIEVWDLDKKCVCGVHHFDKEITSMSSVRSGPYLYVGDSGGDVAVLKLHQDQGRIERMNYHIPFSVSHGKISDSGSDIAVKFVLSQPTAESKRVLVIYSDGVIVLWALHESRVVFSSSGGTSTLQSTYQEAKKVTAACWACSTGSKVVVGYSNGDIILWSLPSPSDSKTEQTQNELGASQITPTYKLNLGYKADKASISKLKWVNADGKSSRLYVLGCSESHSVNSLQVVLLNEQTETRTIKLGLHLPEPLVDMEISASSSACLLLLGRSSRVYTYDESVIERYLVQSQTKSSPSLPKELKITLPYGDSSITVSKFVTSLPSMMGSLEEDFNELAKKSLSLFPFEKTVSSSSSSTFSSFSNARNLLITGHSSGVINFWDASCPLLVPVASITQQSDNDFSISGVPLTALYFSYESQVLVSGDKTGTVRIYTLKSESFAPIGSSKKGSNQIIRRIKVVKVNGAVLCVSVTDNLKQLAVGTDQGYVSLINLESSDVLYQRHIASELCTGIISMHFETCSFHGFEKNVIIVATKDSSLIALERDTGNPLSSGVVRPNKPSVALFTQVLGNESRGSSLPDGTEVDSTSSENSTPKQSFLLLCSEKAVYAYSLSQLIQGVKKVLYKKKFSSSCYWASTFGSPDIGLILLFATGKIEIRSLPDLSLVKESSIRALTPETTVSSSPDGDLVIVNGDQELLFVSTLLNKEAYSPRNVDSVSRVFDKELVNNTQGLISPSSVKDKKKGMFGRVIKDNKSGKAANELEPETRGSRQNAEELSTLFSAVNFTTNRESKEDISKDDEDSELDIDDIEIEDPKEKPRGGYTVIAGLNRNNITNKFQAIKDKLKKNKTDKVPETNEPQDEKTGGAVDQIKKKYGYAYAASSESNAANTAKTKLSENVKKLQGINMKTSEMQDTARSFSSMANQVLRSVENDKK